MKVLTPVVIGVSMCTSYIHASYYTLETHKFQSSNHTRRRSTTVTSTYTLKDPQNLSVVPIPGTYAQTNFHYSFNLPKVKPAGRKKINELTTQDWQNLVRFQKDWIVDLKRSHEKDEVAIPEDVPSFVKAQIAERNKIIATAKKNRATLNNLQ